MESAAAIFWEGVCFLLTRGFLFTARFLVVVAMEDGVVVAGGGGVPSSVLGG